MKNNFYVSLLILLLLGIFKNESNAQECTDCNDVTTKFVDLSSNPDTTWNSEVLRRNGQCCGESSNENCIKFVVKTHPKANLLNVKHGKGTAGSFRFNCGTSFSGSGTTCVQGGSTYCVTYCKSGSDTDRFILSTSRILKTSSDIALSPGCTGKLNVSGLNTGKTITWKSLTNASYNSYLSCTSNCTAPTVTIPSSHPADVKHIDFEVSGNLNNTSSNCNEIVKGTIRVYVNPAKQITFSPQDPKVCLNETIVLTANVTGGAPPYKFSWVNGPSSASWTVGTGKYTVTVTDTASNCNAISKDVFVGIATATSANAGPDQAVCADVASIQLSGSVTGTTKGVWTSDGTGSFSPDANTLNAKYIPSSEDKKLGGVELTLKPDGGLCTPSDDKMKITFNPLPGVNAGSDVSVCKNNSTISLSGTTTGTVAKVEWKTSGTGNFGNSNTTYEPSSDDLTKANIKLTLIATSTQGCSKEDDLTISFTESPKVMAGDDLTICSSTGAQLQGSVTNAEGGLWTTSGDGEFVPSPTSLNANYKLGTQDKVAKSATLTLTSTGNNSCKAVSDELKVNITSSPVVNAGSNFSICPGSNSLQLKGSGSDNSIVYEWKSLNSEGIFKPNKNALDVTYELSNADKTAQKLSFVLIAPAKDGCSEAKDTVDVNFYAPIAVNAGNDQIVCANNSTVILSGTSAANTNPVWSSIGTGYFSPNNTSLSPQYISSAEDISKGKIKLILTATAPSTNCSAKDTLEVTFTNPAQVKAGDDQSICDNNSGVALNGSIVNGKGVRWSSSSGSGSFSPSETALNATYMPGSADKTNRSVILTLTADADGSCKAVSDNVTIAILAAPFAIAGVDQSICKSNPTVNLNGKVEGSTTTGVWTTTGSGSINSATNLNTTYEPTENDLAAGVITFTLTSTNNQMCPASSDELIVSFSNSASVDAGEDKYICLNNLVVNLNGTISGGNPEGSWTTSGTGTFGNASSSQTTYIPSKEDTTSGLVTLTLTTPSTETCAGASDELLVNFTEAPLVNAGDDQTFCGNVNEIFLSGEVKRAAGGQWSTSGSGSFSPNASVLNPKYLPSDADKTSKSVTLTLTSTGSSNSSCNAENDDLIISFTDAPTVNAGEDQTICASAKSVTLNGTSSSEIPIIWTSSTGNGTFIPDNKTLNATFEPEETDKDLGSITLTLASQEVNGDVQNQSCPPVMDNMIITFTQAPKVYAGSDKVLCNDVKSVVFNGSVSNYISTAWKTSGDGQFLANANSITSTYSLGSNDPQVDTIKIFLTATSAGNCTSTDTALILLNKKPIVNAGPDQTVCGNNAAVTLDGSISGAATTGKWTTNGQGTFTPSNTAFNATYNPSASEKAAGKATLVLTSTSSTNCNALDTIVINITPSPIVNAGNDQTVCANSKEIALEGIVTNGGTGQWTSSSGKGSFSPSENDVNAVYKFAPEDVANESVILTLTSSNSNNCAPISDNILVRINPSPIVNAGADQNICTTSSTISLNGTVSGSTTTGTWSSNGTGTFSPSTGILNGTYNLSKEDLQKGSLSFILVSTNNKECEAVQDTFLVSYKTNSAINAGRALEVCQTARSIAIKGTIDHSNPKGEWRTLGSGSFSNYTALETNYLPSTADKNTGFVSLLLSSVSEGDCPGSSDTLKVSFTTAPTVDAGADKNVCSSVTEIALTGRVSGSTAGKWSTSGSGSFNPTDTDLEAKYVPSETDKTTGAVSITLTTTELQNSTCNSVSDNVEINFTETQVSAGSDKLICRNTKEISLNGWVMGETSSGQWSTSGTGTFSPSNTSLNGSYSLSDSDLTKDSILLFLTSTNNIGCEAVKDTMVLNFGNLVIVKAGADQVVCESEVSISVKGEVDGTNPKGRWRTLGLGSFADPDASETTYIPHSEDKNSGSVTLILVSANEGDCIGSSDSIKLTFVPGPTAEAGQDLSICEGASFIQLAGKLKDATSGKWTTSGSGQFLPNETDLQAKYIFSAEDKLGQNVTLTLTSEQSTQATCANSSDQLVVTFTNIEVNTGKDAAVCKSNPILNLNGTVTGGKGKWSTTGSGTFSPNDSTLNATYQPSETDLNSESLEVILSSNISGCDIKRDTLLLTFSNSIAVDAGIDREVCKGADVALEGTVSGTDPKGQWHTLGEGTFTYVDSLKTTYSPGTQDLEAGIVTLVLSSVSDGNCATSSDSIKITFAAPPVANAGIDQTVCKNKSEVILDGTISGATEGTWITSGTGIFSSSNSDLKAKYILSNEDKESNSVTLTLAALADLNSVCTSNASDEAVITFSESQSVNAGEDLIICKNVKSVSLKAIVPSGVKSSWSSSGPGSFAPSYEDLNPVYTLSPEDIAKGRVMLKLTTDPNSECGSISDSVIVKIQETIPVKPTLTLDFVSKDKVDDSKNYLHYSLTNTMYLNYDPVVYRREKGENNFSMIGTASKNDTLFIDANLERPQSAYEYIILGFDACGDSLQSLPHQSISLEARRLDSLVSLEWTPYTGWENGIGKYEIYRKGPGGEYSLASTIKGTVSSIFVYKGLTDGECFRLKAIENVPGNPKESWSNEFCIDYQNNQKLNIPNAISPNNDGVNDVWIIEDLKYFPDNEVTIFNQWDDVVFQIKYYENNWGGEKLPDGTYYYILKAGDIKQKGYLLIVR